MNPSLPNEKSALVRMEKEGRGEGDKAHFAFF
jgi:hypothetical protein